MVEKVEQVNVVSWSVHEAIYACEAWLDHVYLMIQSRHSHLEQHNIVRINVCSPEFC